MFATVIVFSRQLYENLLPNDRYTQLIISIVSMIICVLLAGAFLYGICLEQSCAMLPMLIIQVDANIHV